MALSRDAYKEFEGVVGMENISDDPVIQYAYRSHNITIILPSSTKEVQAVVRLCNKHKIPFKAQSTGWSFTSPNYDFLFLDLRRMNHIIEINEKNMYAVVEPYVISAELQAELFKRGLNCNIKGSGSTCTALALSGHGHMGITTSTGDRNDLATEWVTDEGEIIRLGTLGSSGEWFCGDGPGPSLRGILRSGGIITKQATKVYHWPGPTRFALEGASPRYTLLKVPPNMMVRYFSFPSIGKLVEAELKIGESEISYELMGFCPSMVSSNITTSNEEDFAIMDRFSKEVQGPGFMVIIAGNFPEDFEYRRKVLKQIIKETGGKSLKVVEDPAVQSTLLFQCTRISASIRETFRAGGAFASILVQGQRYDMHVRWLEEAAEMKREMIRKGLVIADDGQQFGWAEEQGHLGHTEIFCRYNPYDAESLKAVKEWSEKVGQRGIDGCFAMPSSSVGMLPADVVGPRVSNYHLWFGKIKKAFDPNGIGENTGFSYAGKDTAGAHTSIYDRHSEEAPAKQ